MLIIFLHVCLGLCLFSVYKPYDWMITLGVFFHQLRDWLERVSNGHTCWADVVILSAVESNI